LLFLAAALAVLGLVVSMIVPAVADGGERVTLRLAEMAAYDEQFDTEIVSERRASAQENTSSSATSPSTTARAPLLASPRDL
jgi:hypothetical protein